MTNTRAETGGTLYIVATPIGNLDDLGARAGKVLGQVALIAAEDTRRCGRLLAHLNLRTRQLALHEHNEDQRAAVVLAELMQGNDVALVSDAGTPLISDPGLHLVQAAAAAGIQVVGIPGPSAVIAALSVAGLPTDRFAFEGFLPRRPAQRAARLEGLVAESRTLVFYEAVHRIEATLADMARIFGPDRPAVIARELSKVHEQLARDTLGGLAAALGSTIPALGEFVIVVAGADVPAGADDSELIRVYGLLAKELPPGKAVALCAKITGRSRNDVYALTRIGQAPNELAD